MISNFSCFYYGYEVTAENNTLDFNEGAGELVATISVGSHTATEFCQALKTALDAAGALTYTVNFNRLTRKITVSATGNFSLLKTSGDHVGASPWSLMGFTQVGDLSGAATYTGATASGDAYYPQFKLQDYVGPEDLQQAVDAVVTKSASGRPEVYKFGIEKFIEMNLMFATDIAQSGPIQSNPTGVDDLRRFMQFLITKAPCEFMESVSDLNAYYTVMLESTQESQNGVGYRLREMYDKGLPGYFQTSKLKFRVLE